MRPTMLTKGIAAVTAVSTAPWWLASCGDAGRGQTWDEFRDSTAAISRGQGTSNEDGDVPECRDIAAPGKPVDAKAVTVPTERVTGVCAFDGESGERMTLSFMWSFGCDDGRTLVFSKEVEVLGFDGEAWQQATGRQIDDTQEAEGCWR